MKNLLLSCVLLASTSSVFAQTVYVGTDAVTGKSVTPWVAKSPTEYAGSYHFGFSECESTFDLAIKNGVATASKEYTDMSDAAKMHNVKKPFTHVRIAGSRFFSDQAAGEFVYFTEGKKRYRALKINSSWSCSQPKNTAEVGVRNN